MSVPTHGPFCQTLVYGTSCRYCQKGIWVLQCTCGSVVLLDERRPPWPKHACANEDAFSGIGGSGFSGWTAVSKLMEMGVTITPDVRRKIFPSSRSPVHKSDRGTEVKRIKPQDGKRHSLLAVVRELHSSTKRIATINTMSTLGCQLLGLDPAARYWQITLVDNAGRPNKSFTAVVPDHLARGLRRGVMVMAEMFGSVKSDFSSWVITSIDPF